jgi:hypothetical protein
MVRPKQSLATSNAKWVKSESFDGMNDFLNTVKQLAKLYYYSMPKIGTPAWGPHSNIWEQVWLDRGSRVAEPNRPTRWPVNRKGIPLNRQFFGQGWISANLVMQ